MKYQSYGLSHKTLMLAAVCMMLAVMLLGAALLEPKRSEPGEWVPLNEAVETALVTLEEQPAAKLEEEKGAAVKELEAGAAVEKLASEAGEAVVTGDGRLNINLATAAELENLKGIGPSKAEAIIKDREQNGKYASIHDLLRVKGIGEKLLSGIQESIVARP